MLYQTDEREPWHRIYDITFISYLIAFGHITSELLIFGTGGTKFPSLSPFIVSCKYLRFYILLQCWYSSSLFIPVSYLPCMDVHAIRLLRQTLKHMLTSLLPILKRYSKVSVHLLRFFAPFVCCLHLLDCHVGLHWTSSSLFTLSGFRNSDLGE